MMKTSMKKIITDGGDRLASDIDPPPPKTKFCKLKEWTDWAMKLKECNQTMK